MFRIGVDVGIGGALALLDDQFHCKEVLDMPVMALSGRKQQVNAAELAKILAKWRAKCDSGLTVYLERASAMPGQGVSSMFNFGVSYGIVQGIVGALQIPMILVSPVVWKKRAGLAGAPKDKSRTLGQQLYPGVDLHLKKHVGRADAILIARFS